MKPALLLPPLLFAATLTAQDNPASRLNRELTLEKLYNPTVLTADKLPALPPASTSTAPPPSSSPPPLLPSLEFDILSPQSLAQQLLWNAPPTRLQLAAGSQLAASPQLAFNAHADLRLIHKPSHQLGLAFSHQSAHAKSPYTYTSTIPAHASLNDSRLAAVFSRHLPSAFTLKAAAQYRFTQPFPRQSSHLFHSSFALASPRAAAPLAFTLDFNYRLFAFTHPFPSNPTPEHALALNFDASHSLNPTQSLALKAHLLALFPQGLNLALSPRFTLHGHTWHATLGADFDFLAGKHKAAIASPHLDADLQLAPATFIYAQSDGYLSHNTAYDLALLNPFAAPIAPLPPSRTWIDARCGLRSRALTNTWFDLFTGYTLTTYDFLFLPDRPLDSRTDVHTQLFFFGATLRYTHSHWAEASLKARFNSWRASTNTSTDAATVFKRPPYTLNANLLLYPTPSLALTFTLNNLLFHSYDLFYGFPAQPFHLLAGLSFAF